MRQFKGNYDEPIDDVGRGSSNCCMLIDCKSFLVSSKVHCHLEKGIKILACFGEEMLKVIGELRDLGEVID